MGVIVYSYGFRVNHEFHGVVENELRKANAYRNKLMELYLKKLSAFRELRADVAPELVLLEQQEADILVELDTIRAAHCNVPKQQRAKHPLSVEARNVAGQLKDHRKVLKEARAIATEMLTSTDVLLKAAIAAELKDSGRIVSPAAQAEARSKATAHLLADPQLPEPWKKKVRLETEYAEQCREARAKCGLSVGTYLAIEDAHQRAIKTSDSDPRFRRFNGVGKLGHQTQKGIRPSMLTVERLDGEKAWSKNWYRCRFNIGRVSDPIWVEGRLTMHRPLPDAAVKWVFLRAERVGGKYHFQLQYTVATEIESPVTGSGVCAVNIGWRSIGDGTVRTGYVVDDTGQEFELRLPVSVSKNAARCRGFLSARDLRFNEVKAWLAPRLSELPEEFANECARLSQWKNPSRLAELIRRATADRSYLNDAWALWKKQRFVNGEDLLLDTITSVHAQTNDVLMTLEWWRRKDQHLEKSARHMERSNVLLRKEFYRVTAADLSKRYAAVVVGPYKTANLKRKPSVENDTQTPQEEASRRVSHMAAPGLLKQTLLEKGNAAKGIEADITSFHFECGNESASDPKASIHLWCEHCKCHFDQDANAAKHLLYRARERLGAGLPISPEASYSIAAE